MEARAQNPLGSHSCESQRRKESGAMRKDSVLVKDQPRARLVRRAQKNEEDEEGQEGDS